MSLPLVTPVEKPQQPNYPRELAGAIEGRFWGLNRIVTKACGGNTNLFSTYFTSFVEWCGFGPDAKKNLPKIISAGTICIAKKMLVNLVNTTIKGFSSRPDVQEIVGTNQTALKDIKKGTTDVILGMLLSPAI